LFTSVTNEAGRQGYLAGKDWATNAQKGAEDAVKNITAEDNPEQDKIANKKLSFKEKWQTAEESRSEYQNELKKLDKLKKESSKKDRKAALKKSTNSEQYKAAEESLKEYSD
jgi:hypothetical protein